MDTALLWTKDLNQSVTIELSLIVRFICIVLYIIRPDLKQLYRRHKKP